MAEAVRRAGVGNESVTKLSVFVQLVNLGLHLGNFLLETGDLLRIVRLIAWCAGQQFVNFRIRVLAASSCFFCFLSTIVP